MADKNHVRALVHATGATMTWAMGYYKAYRFEISQKPEDDMVIDDFIDLSAGNAKVTFVDVLQALIDGANAKFTEFLIVAHGHPKGLIMPMAPGLGSADKDGLPLMTKLAGVVSERDRIRALTDPKRQLEAWSKLLRGLSNQKIGPTTWGPVSSGELGDMKSSADAEAILNRIAPTVKNKSMLENADVLKLLDLRNQVVKKSLKRVEVRACNLGQDPDGMTALREFLGAARVLAPMVKTFYGRVTPTLYLKDADYLKWLASKAPWLTKNHPDPPHSRTYTGDRLFLKLDAKNTTPMSVLKLLQPNFSACAGLAGEPKNYAMIKTLVRDHIDIKNTSGYHGGDFYVGGLDPEAGRTKDNPPPATANGKAFLLASEPEYRQMIVASP